MWDFMGGWLSINISDLSMPARLVLRRKLWLARGKSVRHSEEKECLHTMCVQECSRSRENGVGEQEAVESGRRLASHEAAQRFCGGKAWKWRNGPRRPSIWWSNPQNLWSWNLSWPVVNVRATPHLGLHCNLLWYTLIEKPKIYQVLYHILWLTMHVAYLPCQSKGLFNKNPVI